MKAYIQRAWTGLLELIKLLTRAREEQSSTWTLIVNGYLVLAGVFVAVSILSLSHGKTAVLWPFLVVWLVWVVGINARAGPIALGIWLGV